MQQFMNFNKLPKLTDVKTGPDGDLGSNLRLFFMTAATTLDGYLGMTHEGKELVEAQTILRAS